MGQAAAVARKEWVDISKRNPAPELRVECDITSINIRGSSEIGAEVIGGPRRGKG